MEKFKLCRWGGDIFSIAPFLSSDIGPPQCSFPNRPTKLPSAQRPWVSQSATARLLSHSLHERLDLPSNEYTHALHHLNYSHTSDVKNQ